MAKQVTLTKDEIHHLAVLANLTLTEDEVTKYQEQLKETLAYVENLDELKTEDIIPTSQSVPLVNVYFEDGAKNTKGLTKEEAISNSSSRKGKYFVVKRIM